jgi:hypothetical protein
MVMAGSNAAVEISIGEFMEQQDFLFFGRTTYFYNIVRHGCTTVTHGESQVEQEIHMKAQLKAPTVRL